jgi:3'-phosphoadenosine 5'-phosphosulfate sulfotransferase (PAPS reductase)/FAD synthetase
MDLMLSSREIIVKAIADYKPYAIGLMLSGGDDSMTALHVAKQLGIKIDFIMHGVTGTGVEQAKLFVHEVVSREPFKYIEADAGSAYEQYVLRKGFFGIGTRAHTFSYHVLKANPFRKGISKHIRQGKRNRKIILINGGRRLESENRKKTFIFPVTIDANNIWVNIINDWPNQSTVNYLEGNSIERSPVSKVLCKSGECLCGAMLSPGDRVEIGAHFPVWKAWIDGLRKAVKDKGFTWDWAETTPKSFKYAKMEKMGQMNAFQPMCSSCVVQYKNSF